MLRSRKQEIEMSVGDEKEQRFYFLPCREEERRRRGRRERTIVGASQLLVSASAPSVQVAFLQWVSLNVIS